MLRTAAVPKLGLAGSDPMDLVASSLQTLVIASCPAEAESTVLQPYVVRLTTSEHLANINQCDRVGVVWKARLMLGCCCWRDSLLQPRSFTRMKQCE